MFTESQQAHLYTIARAAIQHGLQHHQAMSLNVQEYEPALQAIRATFVTLKRHGHLRGCIGTLEARRPVAADVAYHAYAAAFQDKRFSPLIPAETRGLILSIAVLTPAEQLLFTSESDLLRQLRPHIDGLILVENQHVGTFLPAVWENLPQPTHFLQQLKRKAGLAPDYWSNTLEFFRYTTENFPPVSF